MGEKKTKDCIAVTSDAHTPTLPPLPLPLPPSPFLPPPLTPPPRRLEVLRGEDLDRARKETLGVKEEVDFWRSKFDSMVKESDEARFKFERERNSMLRDMEEARREQQRTAREREEDMEAQRREVTGTFDEVLRVREMEGRRREEELKNSLRETESRLSDAMGQVELCRGREVDLRALAERDRASAEEAERALRQTRWACEDQIRVNDGKLMEKERLLEETKKVKDEMTEEVRYGRMDDKGGGGQIACAGALT